MSPGAIFIGLALLAPIFIFVAEPFRTKNGRRKAAATKNLAKAPDRYSETLVALRDLDFDQRTGKIIDQDYAALRSELLTKAALELEIKKLKDQEIEDRLEKSIQAHKNAKTSAQSCAKCGARLRPGDLFCSTCGSPQEPVCQHCGHAIDSSDQFCVGCGQPVTFRVTEAKAETI
jgi:hypothetical protein